MLQASLDQLFLDAMEAKGKAMEGQLLAVLGHQALSPFQLLQLHRDLCGAPLHLGLVSQDLVKAFELSQMENFRQDTLPRTTVVNFCQAKLPQHDSLRKKRSLFKCLRHVVAKDEHAGVSYATVADPGAVGWAAQHVAADVRRHLHIRPTARRQIFRHQALVLSKDVVCVGLRGEE